MHLLKKSELFKKVTLEELKVLIPFARQETLTMGSIIFYQDNPAEKLYLLDSGIVALKTSFSEGMEITYEMIAKKGDPFGWSSLVAPYRHTTTAICLEETKILFFRRIDLNRILPRHPTLGFKVMQNLCVLIARRLDRTRQLIVGQI